METSDTSLARGNQEEKRGKDHKKDGKMMLSWRGKIRWGRDGNTRWG